MSQHELLPMEKWVSEDERFYYLHDPISGERLDAAQPPAFLLDNPRLNDGRSYGQWVLHKSSICVLYTDGETSAQALGGADSMMPLETTIDDPELGIRAVGHAVDGAVWSAEDGAMRLLPQRRNPYTQRLETAADARLLPQFYAGIEVDRSGALAGSTERTIAAIQGAVLLERASEPDELQRMAAEDAPTGIELAARLILKHTTNWYKTLSALQQLGDIHAGYASRGEPLNTALLAASFANLGMTEQFIANGVGRSLPEHDSVGEAQVDDGSIDRSHLAADAADAPLLNEMRIPRSMIL